VSALLGAMVLTAVALVAVIVDLLRTHGRVLRALHAIDPDDSSLQELEGRSSPRALSASLPESPPTPPRS
jgi:hypothetical protein